MANKEVDTQARLSGKLDVVDFDVFAMKEPDYKMIVDCPRLLKQKN